MSGTFNFTYLFANGWTIGTQPSLSVDWKARGGERGTFGIGTTGGQDVQMRRPADAVPVAGSVLPGSSRRRRSEVEYSAASDSDDSGPHQESALLTRGSRDGRCSPETPSLPFSTNQATALKPRVYPLGTDQPEAAIGLSERVDFHVGELDAPLAQGPEGFDRSLEKIRAELLVCQNLADDQLHGSLRHDLHAVGRLPRFRAAFSTSLPSRRRKSNVAAAVRFARNPRKSADSVRRGRRRSV